MPRNTFEFKLRYNFDTETFTILCNEGGGGVIFYSMENSVTKIYAMLDQHVREHHVEEIGKQ